MPLNDVRERVNFFLVLHIYIFGVFIFWFSFKIVDCSPSVSQFNVKLSVG